MSAQEAAKQAGFPVSSYSKYANELTLEDAGDVAWLRRHRNRLGCSGLEKRFGTRKERACIAFFSEKNAIADDRSRRAGACLRNKCSITGDQGYDNCASKESATTPGHRESIAVRYTLAHGGSVSETLQ